MTAFGSDQQEIGHVGAGNQEHHPDAAHQNPKQFAHVADHILAERPNIGPHPRLLEEVQTESRGGGKTVEHDGPHPRHVGVRRLHCNTGPQSGNPFVAELAKRGFATIETNRQEERGLLPIEEAKFLWHDPDDLARFAVHSNGVSDDGPIRAKAALPIVVAEHHGVGATWAAVGAIEPSTQNRRKAEDRKHAVGDIERLHLFGVALPGDTHRISLINADILESGSARDK